MLSYKTYMSSTLLVQGLTASLYPLLAEDSFHFVKGCKDWRPDQSIAAKAFLLLG